jgi:hypothetical protein
MGTENLAHVVEYLPSKCEALVPPEKKTKQTQKKGQMWWHMPTIPVLRRMSKRSLSWTPVWALRDPVSKKKKTLARHQARRITVRGQPGANSLQAPIYKITREK